ncbi:3-isopropylmalate dehydratase small subunit [Pigmentiphaga sp. GD03639]|uniref:3-isopropylmalate dehydratase small subunit n=1 Tax=Pigmentiphaga daeguensis TaxID=414049 RepID=A0ABN1C7U6_9BURK|nr:3-isopropylmalate dehydratase small subunit [Pigmentiphaga sp. GD03639]MDH2236612.1 3-isopropylmalate dehydratase small subunit [Pigmentiphaga sp. GD03639]
MMFSGKVHKLGDSIDTDVMVPGRYLSLLDPAEIAKHIFEEVDPGFAGRVRPGDVIVAGRNFGAGSGREQAPFGLKALGIGCIVAASFSRTFYRMSIDLGLPILISPEVASAARDGQAIEVDTRSGIVRLDGVDHRVEPLPSFIQEIIDLGGVTGWVKREVARRQAAGAA